MKALILSSGIGKRLYPLTKNMPKSLIKIQGKEILGFQVDHLIECGIKDLIITTGPFENKIKEYIRKNYSGMNVFYIKNSKYESTNYIYSMWLTKELIDDEIILLHGDLLFSKKLLNRLVDKEGNRAAVNKKIKLPEKDFKAVIEKGRVKKIGTEFFEENAFACFPLYKFSKKDFLLWLSECEKYIKRGKVNIYAEDVFNEISDKMPLYPLYFNDELCMEIDTKEDIEKANRILITKDF